VSQGLLDRFTEDEARAVLAHEIGHVANGDMITLALIQGSGQYLCDVCARVIGFFVDRVILKNNRGLGLGYWITTIVAEIILAFGFNHCYVVLPSARIPRRCRWCSAGWTRRHGGSAGKLRAETQSHVENQMPDTMTAFGISSGWKRKPSKLFMTHPPLEERIQALKNG